MSQDESKDKYSALSSTAETWQEEMGHKEYYKEKEGLSEARRG